MPFTILYCYLDSTQVPQAAFLKTGCYGLCMLSVTHTRDPCPVLPGMNQVPVLARSKPDLCFPLTFANFTPPTLLSPTSEGPGLAFYSLQPERTSGYLHGGSLATSTTLSFLADTTCALPVPSGNRSLVFVGSSSLFRYTYLVSVLPDKISTESSRDRLQLADPTSPARFRPIKLGNEVIHQPASPRSVADWERQAGGVPHLCA